MLPASNKGPSENFGFPDVCLTPVASIPVPIPYPNFAAHAMAVDFVPNVMVGMIPALNLASMIPMTTGDDAGVDNWTYEGLAEFVEGNPCVIVGGLPGICLTCPALGNKGNVETAVVAPGAPNVLYTLAEEAASIEARLAGPPLAGEGFAAEGVGYLRVNVFSFGLPAAVDTAVCRLAARGMRALVLDLRGCPGGELSSFLELGGDFLPRGAELVTMTDAEGDDLTYRAGRAQAHRFPIALLVDGGTASAAELFAACLAAHGRALVVGAPTHGKRTGQVLLRGASGEVVPVTTARFSPPGCGEGVLDATGRVVPHLAAGAENALALAVSRLAPAA
jgi:carboxyl-terminal processing protease